MKLLDPRQIQEASEFIAPYIIKTPFEKSNILSRVAGTECYFKLENLQKTGSFKLRGALYKLGRLHAGGCNYVVSCSAGNHGWALAWAGEKFGCGVKVFVPSSADQSKCRGMAELGAEVVKCPSPGYDKAENTALEYAASQGTPFISPYDDYEIMAGNGGTLAMEILEQLPETGSIVFPVGGGGLGAGIASLVRSRRPGITLVGCQHLDSPALALSLEKGYAVTELPPVDTIAGGIEGGIGVKTFEILRDTIDKVILVSEEDLKKSIVWLMEHHRYIVEASGAAPVAAALSGKLSGLPSPAMLVLTGRNISLSTLSSLMPG